MMLTSMIITVSSRLPHYELYGRNGDCRGEPCNEETTASVEDIRKSPRANASAFSGTDGGGSDQLLPTCSLFPLRMSEEDLATRASHGIEMCYGASTPHLSFYEEADTEDVNTENVTFTSVRRKRRKDSSKLLRFHTESLDLSGMKCFLFRGGLVSQIPGSQYLSAGRQGKLSRARSRLYRSRFLQRNT